MSKKDKKNEQGIFGSFMEGKDDKGIFGSFKESVEDMAEKVGELGDQAAGSLKDAIGGSDSEVDAGQVEKAKKKRKSRSSILRRILIGDYGEEEETTEEEESGANTELPGPIIETIEEDCEDEEIHAEEDCEEEEVADTPASTIPPLVKPKKEKKKKPKAQKPAKTAKVNKPKPKPKAQTPPKPKRKRNYIDDERDLEKAINRYNERVEDYEDGEDWEFGGRKFDPDDWSDKNLKKIEEKYKEIEKRLEEKHKQILEQMKENHKRREERLKRQFKNRLERAKQYRGDDGRRKDRDDLPEWAKKEFRRAKGHGKGRGHGRSKQRRRRERDDD